jgi:hypothetical protein
MPDRHTTYHSGGEVNVLQKHSVCLCPSYLTGVVQVERDLLAALRIFCTQDRAA